MGEDLGFTSRVVWFDVMGFDDDFESERLALVYF